MTQHTRSESTQTTPTCDPTNMAELFHHFQNTLQTISSIIMMHHYQLGAPKLNSATIQQRILAFSRTYHVISKSAPSTDCSIPDLIGINLDAICKSTTRPMGQNGIQLQLDPVQISLKRASAIGLILHETLQNVATHAWGNQPLATLSIQLTTPTPLSAQLVIQDQGPGLPEDWQLTDHLGLQFVDLMTQQLDGDWSIKSNKGTRFELVFPV